VPFLILCINRRGRACACYVMFNHVVVILAVSAWLLLARKSSAEAAAPVVAETADNTSKAAEAGAHSSGKAPLAEADTAVEDDDSAVDHRNGSSSTARRKRVEMRVIYGTTTVKSLASAF